MRTSTLESLKKYINGIIPDHYVNEPGREAYACYADLARGLRPGGIVSDLGTYQGLSALAFSINPKIEVISYDIDLSNNLVSGRNNIKFVESDVFDHMDEILKSDIILVDLDPHDGIQEQRMLDVLAERGYTGISIWDDIHLNIGMNNFWHKVAMPKEDKTNIGHHSGTGRINHG